MKNENKKQRLFIAVPLPADAKSVLADICQNFAEKNLFEGRCTHPENFHLTLKFLGDVTPDLVDEIDAALKTISFQSYDAKLGPLDVLPSREKIRFLFCHLRCSELHELVFKIEDILADRFERKEREFKSHVTVARIKSIEDEKKFLQEVDQFAVPDLQWKINSFVLKESMLTPEGPIYNVVKRYEII